MEKKDLDCKWIVPMGGEGTDGLLLINHNGIPQNQVVVSYSRNGWDGSWDVTFSAILGAERIQMNLKGIDEEALRETICDQVIIFIS